MKLQKGLELFIFALLIISMISGVQVRSFAPLDSPVKVDSYLN